MTTSEHVSCKEKHCMVTGCWSNCWCPCGHCCKWHHTVNFPLPLFGNPYGTWILAHGTWILAHLTWILARLTWASRIYTCTGNTFTFLCKCNHVLWIAGIWLRAFCRYTTIHPTVVVEIGHAFISCMSNNTVIPWPLSSSPLLPCTCAYSHTQAPPHASSLVPNLFFQHLFLLSFSCTSSLHAHLALLVLFLLPLFPPSPPLSLSPCSSPFPFPLLSPSSPASPFWDKSWHIILFTAHHFDSLPFDVLAAIRVKLASLFLVCTFLKGLAIDPCQ